MLRNFQAEAGAEKASRLEQQGQAGDLADSAAAIAELGADLDEVGRNLRRLLAVSGA